MPERVWEQSLTSDLCEAGIAYTLLDDFHFSAFNHEHTHHMWDELREMRAKHGDDRRTILSEEVAGEAVENGAQDYVYKSQLVGDQLMRAVLYALSRQQLMQQLVKVKRCFTFKEKLILLK